MKAPAVGDLVQVKSVSPEWVMWEWVGCQPQELVGRLGVVSAPPVFGLYPVWLEGYEHRPSILFRPTELGVPR